MTLEELLPPGVYPIWSPYASCEAAAALMKAFVEDQAEQTLTVQETGDLPRQSDDQ